MSAPVSLIDQISAAMSVSSLRHEVIASNIANRDTEGYQRLALRFDRAMSSAEVASENSEATVSLEQDLVDMSANSMQYEAMARVLNRYFSIIATIASSNRG